MGDEKDVAEAAVRLVKQLALACAPCSSAEKRVCEATQIWT
jgi:hypothetical protein